MVRFTLYKTPFSYNTTHPWSKLDTTSQADKEVVPASSPLLWSRSKGATQIGPSQWFWATLALTWSQFAIYSEFCYSLDRICPVCHLCIHRSSGWTIVVKAKSAIENSKFRLLEWRMDVSISYQAVHLTLHWLRWLDSLNWIVISKRWHASLSLLYLFNGSSQSECGII